MKQHVLDFICCPTCKGNLSLAVRKQYRNEIQSGTLYCESCSGEYPIVSDRPVLMSNNAIHNWLSPIDEALNPNEITRPEGPLSILRLRRLGIDKAKETALSQINQATSSTFNILDDLKQLIGKIKYIKSGKWFNARNRGDSWLNSLRNPSKSVKSFLSLVESRNPDSLLDIASGGGSGVASIANVLPADVKVFSAERDLKCLWIIQEKFKYIRKETRSEAIGSDVRQLPFKNDSINTVTSMMAMQELLGISSVLKEIHRVLKPGGSYIALFNKEPWVYDMMQVEQYKRFAEAVDMYSGYTDLVSTAEKVQLSLIGLEEFTENEKEFCLVELGKDKK